MNLLVDDNCEEAEKKKTGNLRDSLLKMNSITRKMTLKKKVFQIKISKKEREILQH